MENTNLEEDNGFNVENQSGPPELRYLDETPKAKTNANKRARSELSPINENELEKNTHDAMQSAIKEAIPDIVAKIMKKIDDTINNKVKEALKGVKEDLRKDVNQEFGSIEAKIDMKSKCDVEMIEQYNRRDNIKVFGIREEVTGDNVPIHETPEHTMQKVISVCQDIEAEINQNDISIAHRLPSRNNAAKPIIVKFSRRVAKIEVMRKKRILREQASAIKIFEDLSKPRMNFLHLLKSDVRIAAAWTKEGNIFYTMKDHQRVHKISNLYNGAMDLGYMIQDLESCFFR